MAKPVAIIGMGCRFPGGANLDSFWELLICGQSAISEIPKDRWNAQEYYSESLDRTGTTNSTWGAFLSELKYFDASFFGLSKAQAEQLDPQHRLMLEVTWEAIEYARIAPSSLRGAPGAVFFGIGSSEYGLNNVYTRIDELKSFSIASQECSIGVSRISRFLGLTGPSLAVNAGCASVYAALHLACRSLENYESRLAVVGGVNAILSPVPHIILSQAGIMAADGRSKSFDKSSDGYVRGEGCGVIVLKLLEDALADRNFIHAVINGSALNQSGFSVDVTASSAAAQAEAIKVALGEASINPSEVCYVEAHGVSPSGDIEELRALHSVYGDRHQADSACVISCVKGNVGHLEWGSGAVSLIKAVLALKHGEIPRLLHLNHPISPDSSEDFWRNTRLKLADSSVKMPSQPRPLFVGLNSFGIGGTNAHVILSNPTYVRSSSQRMNSKPNTVEEVLVLSAKSSKALQDLCQSYIEKVLSNPDLDLSDICFSAAVTRNHFEFRKAFVGLSKRQIEGEIRTWIANGGVATQFSATPPTIGLNFLSGDLEDFKISELYASQPLFRESLNKLIERYDARFQDTLGDRIRREGVESLRVGAKKVWFFNFALAYTLVCRVKKLGILPQGIIGEPIYFQASATALDLIELDKIFDNLERASEQCFTGLSFFDSIEKAQHAGMVEIISANQIYNAASLVRLSELGVPIDWLSYYVGQDLNLIDLPKYPFQRKQYWIDSEKASLPVSESETEAKGLLIQKLLGTEESKRQDVLAEFLEGEIKEVLGLPETQKLDCKAGLMSLGMDSLMVVEFKNRLTRALGTALNQPLPATLIFNYPNIDTIAGFLLKEVLVSRLNDNNLKRLPIEKTKPRYSRSVDTEEYFKGVPNLHPISSLQDRMLSSGMSIPNEPALHTWFDITFESELDVNLLEKCINQIIQEQDCFRVGFHKFGSELFEITYPTKVFSQFNVDIVSKILLTEDFDTLKETYERTIFQPFDTMSGPLYRFNLIKYRTKYILLSVIHHIITDGSSINLFLDRLRKIYQGKSQIIVQTRPEIQYSKYWEWERDFFTTEENAKIIEWWKTQLSDFRPAGIIPDNSELDASLSATDELMFEIKEATLIELRNRAKGLETTLFVLFLTAYFETMRELSGQDDLTIGTFHANRSEQTQNTMGLFADILLLRARLNQIIDKTSILKHIQAMVAESFQKSGISFREIAKSLPQFSNFHSEFRRQIKATIVFNKFEAFFSTEENWLINRYSSNLKIEKNANFEMELVLFESNHFLIGKVVYARNLFRAETIKNFLEIFLKKLNEFI